MNKRLFPWLPAGLLTVLAAFLLLLQPVRAHPPRQEGDQPSFTSTSQSAPDGSATVELQETRLDGAYFSANGSAEGLTITTTGLALADGSASGVYSSGTIHSPLALTTDLVPLWAAEIPEGTELRLETRLSLDGGESWSDWLENPEAFYPVRDNLHAGNLIWAGGERVTVQFRVTLSSDRADASPTFDSLVLVFSDTSQGPNDGAIAAQMAEAAAAPAEVCPVSKPAVVSRTAWGCPDGQNSPRRPPTYAPVTHVILHQSETPNTPGPYQDWAGWVRSVWNYHANVLWWGDVGYNYLIDPAGTVYEGRAGGDDVAGIHDRTNRGSLAIGFLGCYGNCDDPRLDVAEPSPDMLAAAANLIAWKLGQAGIDPLGAGPYAGQNSVPVIAGGRDVVATTSPGDNIYDRLPDLRAAVAEKTTCTPLRACRVKEIIFDQAEYEVNQTIRLTARLVDSTGAPLGGALVQATVTVTPATLSSQAAGDFELIDRTGDYDGSYSQTEIPGDYNFLIQASDPSGSRFLACSAAATVRVNAVAPLAPCQVSVIADKAGYQPGETMNLIATVTNDQGTLQTGAVVTATVTRPDDSLAGPLAFTGAGPYNLGYANTNLEGSYRFDVTATDPTGLAFSPCSVEKSLAVAAQPGGVLVKVNPISLTIPLCTPAYTSTVGVQNVSGLRAVDIEVSYNPQVIEVLDSDPTESGVQVALAGELQSLGAFVAENEVDNTTGRIQFAATLVGGDLINGASDFIRIPWRPVAAGTSAIALDEVTLVGAGGQAITHETAAATVQVTSGCGGPIVGIILLQGRTNHGGVIISGEGGQQAQTAADGSFAVDGGRLSFTFPGYLSAQAEAPAGLGGAGTQPARLGTLTLLAGDINGDNKINIFDLAALAGRYRSQDPTGDFNGDGEVNILDLALAAGNYQRQGPLTEWR